MSTKADQVTTQRLQSIEQRLEEMVERKWTPLREENGSEPMEVATTDDHAYVGYVNRLWSQLLMDDVIRTFDSGYYEFWNVGGERGRQVEVYPTTAAEFYEIPDGADVRRAAAIEALDETGIHVPHIVKSNRALWFKHFETESEAEHAAAALEGPVETAYESMRGKGVEKTEIREVEEPREWLAPDSWYLVLVFIEQ